MTNGDALRRLTKNAMLTTIALTIFTLEAQIPLPIPIPGVKLGLANIVTVYAMFALTPADAIAILLCRVTLGAIFAGQMMSFFYSLCGGLLCYLTMLLVRPIMSEGQIPICSILGAVAHNVGQIIAAIIVTKTLSIVSYLPFLLISGIVSGAFTGLCAYFVTRRMKPKQ